MAKGYYHRSFVILQPWDSKFNVKTEKPPAGYCKIEVRNDKCRMYFHVQDLKSRGVQREGYDVFLVSAQGGIPPQRIASIYVDQRGRGECTVEINVNDVDGSGYSLDQFHGLAVVCYDRDDISYPLVGYANKRVELDWAGRIKRDIGKFYNTAVKAVPESRKEGGQMRSLEEEGENRKPKTIQDIISALGPLLQSKMQESQTESERSRVEQVQEREDFDIVKNSDGNKEKLEDSTMMAQGPKRDEEAMDIQNDEGYGPSEMSRDVVEAEIKEDVPGVGGATEASMEDVFQVDKEIGKFRAQESVTEGAVSARGQVEKQTDEAELGSIEGEAGIQQRRPDLSRKQTYWEKTKEYYTRLFETHRRVYPFMAEMGEVQWVEVPYEDDYGQYAYIAPQHIGKGHYYGHYIVGLVKEKGEVRYVAYGIPGPYGTMPPLPMQGFYRWAPSRYGYGMGYWLLYIDAHTGQIAYPY